MTSDSWRSGLVEAAAVVKRGGVIAYPTESCFGIGCDPGNRTAIRRILAMKKRARSKGLILIADRYARLRPYLATLPKAQLKKCLECWPGPTTWLWPVAETVSPWLAGTHTTLAVRVTAHAPASALCRAVGRPLVSTSANRAGQPALRNARRVRDEFSDEIDFVLDGPIGPGDRPSKIIDCQTLEVIRA